MDHQRRRSESGKTGLDGSPRPRLYIGADHRGFLLKKKIVAFLRHNNIEVADVGTYDPVKKCDYPSISYKVAMSVVGHKGSRGILVCWSGIGHSMAANKVAGVRAALCYNREAALLSRQHNDANILILGSKFVPQKYMFEIVRVFLNTKFEGGRHSRRVRQIQAIEKKCMRTARGT